MDFLPKNYVLEIRSDTMEYIRTKYGLNEPGRMKEAINILDNWVQQQPHFKKKDFTTHYLESFIIVCKGSIERVKMRLDKLCTQRTLLAQYFGSTNVKYDFGNSFDFASGIIMPKTTEDHYRITLVKFHSDQFTPTDYLNFYRYAIVMAEYEKTHDYVDGFILIFDLSEISITEFLSRLDLVITRQAMSIVLETYGMRLKSVHIITKSKFVNALINFVKQFLSSKIGSRIFANKTVSELYSVIDKKLLPKDYGGDEPSLRELQDIWINILSSEEHLKHLANISKATTDESLRQTDKFNELYAGLPGTFRTLKVD